MGRWARSRSTTPKALGRLPAGKPAFAALSLPTPSSAMPNPRIELNLTPLSAMDEDLDDLNDLSLVSVVARQSKTRYMHTHNGKKKKKKKNILRAVVAICKPLISWT